MLAGEKCSLAANEQSEYLINEIANEKKHIYGNSTFFSADFRTF